MFIDDFALSCYNNNVKNLSGSLARFRHGKELFDHEKNTPVTKKEKRYSDADFFAVLPLRNRYDG